jgi:hypothetical protein
MIMARKQKNAVKQKRQRNQGPKLSRAAKSFQENTK